MTAPLHPQPLDDAQPHPIFSRAFADVVTARINQVERHGHTAAADDARGVYRLLNTAHQPLLAAIDMAIGDPARLTPQCRAVLRRRMVKAAAIIIAAADTLDRLPIDFSTSQQQGDSHG